MTDRMDAEMLSALEGDQTCECCGRDLIGPEDVDVMDGEVTCLDCMACYYNEVYERRSQDGYDFL